MSSWLLETRQLSTLNLLIPERRARGAITSSSDCWVREGSVAVEGFVLPENRRMPRRHGRRRFIKMVGQVAALSNLGLLAACQSPPETIVVTPPPARSAPAIAAATATPAA